MRIPAKTIVLTAVLALMLHFSPRVVAQPGPPYIACLDTIVINARYVFVGKIVEIHELNRSGANSNANVEVEERLKGDVGNTTQALIDVPTADLQNWKALGSRLLIANGGAGLAIDLSAPNLMVLTADMKLLRDPEHVLQAAREAIDRHPGVYGIDTVPRRVLPELAAMLPNKQTGCSNETWWTTCLMTAVPADEDLERWAVRAADSSLIGERAEAADALGHFRPTAANEALLRKLLEDPGLVVTTRAERNNGHEIQTYVVRKRAYDALIRWGVKLPEPVFERETDGPERGR